MTSVVNLEEIDFDDLDNRWNFKNREDKLSRARILGYRSIMEAYVSLYEKYQSTILVGKIMGVNASSVIKVFTQANIPRGGRGGAPRYKDNYIPEVEILQQHGFHIPDYTADYYSRKIRHAS